MRKKKNSCQSRLDLWWWALLAVFDVAPIHFSPLIGERRLFWLTWKERSSIFIHKPHHRLNSPATKMYMLLAHYRVNTSWSALLPLPFLLLFHLWFPAMFFSILLVRITFWLSVVRVVCWIIFAVLSPLATIAYVALCIGWCCFRHPAKCLCHHIRPKTPWSFMNSKTINICIKFKYILLCQCYHRSVGNPVAFAFGIYMEIEEEEGAPNGFSVATTMAAFIRSIV